MTNYAPTLPPWQPRPETLPNPEVVSRTAPRFRLPPTGNVSAADGKIVPVVYGFQHVKARLGARGRGRGPASLQAQTCLGLSWILCLGGTAGIEGDCWVYYNGDYSRSSKFYGGHGQTRTKNGGNSYNYLLTTQYLGLPTQTVDPTLEEIISGYTDDNVFRENGMTVGVAYIVTAQNKFYDQELATIEALVKGCRVYDPRGEQISYSENIVLHLADILSAPYGANWSADWSSVGYAADRADEIMSDGSKRYSGGFTVTDATSIAALIERVRMLCGVIVGKEGDDTFFFEEDKPGTSTFVFDSSKIEEGSLELSYRSIADTPSSVEVSYTHANQVQVYLPLPWKTQTVVYPEPGDPGYSSSIDERRVTQIAAPDIQTASQARRLAKRTYLQYQEAPWLCSFATTDVAVAVREGDIVTVDHQQLPSSKEFRVVDVIATHSELRSLYQVQLEQYSGTAYPDDTVVEDAPSPELQDPETISGGSVIELKALEAFGSEWVLVNVSDAPDDYCRLADSIIGYPAEGFAYGTDADDIVSVTLNEGVVLELENIVSGRYFLGAAGAFVTAPPVGAKIIQNVGQGEPDTRIIFHALVPVWTADVRHHQMIEVDATNGSVQESKRVLGEAPGGCLEGCAVTRNTSTSYNVSAGQVALMDPSDTTRTIILACAGVTNQTPGILTGNAQLFVYVDVNGAVGDMLSDQFTHGMIRDRAVIGEITLDALGTIVDSTDIADFRYGADRIAALAVDRWISEGRWEFPESGFLLVSKSATIQLILSAGVLFRAGINSVDPRNPNRLSFIAEDPMTFDVIIRDDTLVSEDTTSVNVTQWDNGGTLTTLTNNRAVMHMMYKRGKNNYLQIGQNEDAKSVSEALANFDNLVRSFVIAQSLSATGTYITGAVIIIKGATDLSIGTQAAVIDRTHFGSSSGGGGGGDTTGLVRSVSLQYSDADGNVILNMLQDTADPTKFQRHDFSAYPTGTTRTVTWPAIDGTAVIADNAQIGPAGIAGGYGLWQTGAGTIYTTIANVGIGPGASAPSEPLYMNTASGQNADFSMLSNGLGWNLRVSHSSQTFSFQDKSIGTSPFKIATGCATNTLVVSSNGVAIGKGSSDCDIDVYSASSDTIIAQTSGSYSWKWRVANSGGKMDVLKSNTAVFSIQQGAGQDALVLGPGAIGVNAPPRSGYALDLVSTVGALGVPSQTTTERLAYTPAESMIVYDTTLKKHVFYDASGSGGSWKAPTMSPV